MNKKKKNYKKFKILKKTNNSARKNCCENIFRQCRCNLFKSRSGGCHKGVKFLFRNNRELTFLMIFNFEWKANLKTWVETSLGSVDANVLTPWYLGVEWDHNGGMGDGVNLYIQMNKNLLRSTFKNDFCQKSWKVYTWYM